MAPRPTSQSNRAETEGHDIDYVYKMYSIYIDYIRHENELISQRSGRFVTLQSVLIASLGISIRYENSAPQTHDAFSIHFLQLNWLFVAFSIIVSVIGLSSSWTAFTAIKAAKDAQNRTNDSWRSPRPSGRSLYDLAREFHFPELMGGGVDRSIGLAVHIEADRGGGNFSLYLPIFFLCFWILPPLGLLVLSIYFR